MHLNASERFVELRQRSHADDAMGQCVIEEATRSAIDRMGYAPEILRLNTLSGQDRATAPGNA